MVPEGQMSPRLATSLSNLGPGTKAWTRPTGPLQRPANYLSRGAPKPRAKLFRDGDTSFFHRMYDELGELVGVAAPHVVDSAVHNRPHAPVKANQVRGFFNALLTDAEVAAFEERNPLSPEEVQELIDLFDDESGGTGEMTQAQMMTCCKKYRTYDPDRLLKERRIMFRLREHLLEKYKLTVQEWFDSIGAKQARDAAREARSKGLSVDKSDSKGSITSAKSGASVATGSVAAAGGIGASWSLASVGGEGDLPSPRGTRSPVPALAGSSSADSASIGGVPAGGLWGLGGGGDTPLALHSSDGSAAFAVTAAAVVEDGASLLSSHGLRPVDEAESLGESIGGEGGGEGSGQLVGASATASSSTLDEVKAGDTIFSVPVCSVPAEATAVTSALGAEPSSLAEVKTGDTSEGTTDAADLGDGATAAAVPVEAAVGSCGSGDGGGDGDGSDGADGDGDNGNPEAADGEAAVGGASGGVKKEKTAWTPNPPKADEHNERVGMTEFRKSLKERLGPLHAFNARDEKRFFKYMGDVQFNAYAPAEVPCAQVEAALRHADRTHLESRMSVVFRRLDRRLRFCGMGLEDLFPARLPEGAGGFTVTGRARASPEKVYKVKYLVGVLRVLLAGKNKKKNSRPARDPHWVTFYYTLDPVAPPRRAGSPPPKASIAGVAGGGAVMLAAAKMMGRGSRPVTAEDDASAAQRRSRGGGGGGGGGSGTDDEDEDDDATASTGGGTAALGLGSLRSTREETNHSQASARSGRSVDSKASSGYGGSKPSRAEEKAALARLLAQQIEEERVAALTRVDKFRYLWRQPNEGTAEENAADAASGLVRTGVLRKYGCVLEVVEERNGWPWERVVVDLDPFSVTVITVPLDQAPRAAKPWRRQAAGAEAASAAALEGLSGATAVAPAPSPRLPGAHGLAARTMAAGDAAKTMAVGMAETAAPSLVEISSPLGPSPADPTDPEADPKTDPAAFPADEPDAVGEPPAAASPEPAVPQLFGAFGLAPRAEEAVGAAADGCVVGAAEGAVAEAEDVAPEVAVPGPFAPVSRTWSVAVVPAAHFDRKGAAESKARNAEPNGAAGSVGAWANTRAGHLGGSVGGYCFVLSHPRGRLNAWCRTAADINSWVGGLTGVRVPLHLHSERLPPVEVSEDLLKEDGGGGDDGNGSVGDGVGSGAGQASSLLERGRASAMADSSLDAGEKGGEVGDDPAVTSGSRGGGSRPGSRPGSANRKVFSFGPRRAVQTHDAPTKAAHAGVAAGAAPVATGLLAAFAANPSRRRLCCFCGEGDPLDVQSKEKLLEKQAMKKALDDSRIAASVRPEDMPATGRSGPTAAKRRLLRERLAKQRREELATAKEAGKGASSSALATAGRRVLASDLKAAGLDYASLDRGQPGGDDDASTVLAPMRWGLKPRECFLPCPFGLISDLACWPCLAANGRSSHSEQQANVTVPRRAHGALYHASDVVMGWTHAPPATVAAATAHAAEVAEATTLRGYRTAVTIDTASVAAHKGHLAATVTVSNGPLPATPVRRPPVYNPGYAARMSVDATLKKPKRAAEVESASDEEGWILEATDDDVMDVRYDLDKRLAWIDETSARIAPLVKAQFRRALVQDKELRRRRARLLARVAEQKVIPGGIGTGVITGQAWIPALPTLEELEAAKASTLASFKVAMAGRAYSRVTALEEQLFAITSTKDAVAAQQASAQEADEAREVERRRPKARAPWDATEGAFLRSDPLLFALGPDPGGGGGGRGSADAADQSAGPVASSMATTAAVSATGKGSRRLSALDSMGATSGPAEGAVFALSTRALGRATGREGLTWKAPASEEEAAMSPF